MPQERDLMVDLLDLHHQATTERSHYYVGRCIRRAIAEIATLRTGWEGPNDVSHLWILVPKDPTPEMIKAAGVDRATAARVWANMWKAVS
jgi:hypothetical protein